LFFSALILIANGIAYAVDFISPADIAEDMLDDLENWTEIPIPFDDLILLIVNAAEVKKEIREASSKLFGELLLDVIWTVIVSIASALAMPPLSRLLAWFSGGERTLMFLLGRWILRIYLALVFGIVLVHIHPALAHYLTNIGAVLAQLAGIGGLAALWYFLRIKKSDYPRIVLRLLVQHLFPFINQLLTWVCVVLIQSCAKQEQYIQAAIIAAVGIALSFVFDIIGIGDGKLYRYRL